MEKENRIKENILPYELLTSKEFAKWHDKQRAVFREEDDKFYDCIGEIATIQDALNSFMCFYQDGIAEQFEMPASEIVRGALWGVGLHLKRVSRELEEIELNRLARWNGRE